MDAGLANAPLLQDVGDRLEPAQGRGRVVDGQLDLAEDPPAVGRVRPVPLCLGRVDSAGRQRAGVPEVAAAGLDKGDDVGGRPFLGVAGLAAPAGGRGSIGGRGVPVPGAPLDIGE